MVRKEGGGKSPVGFGFSGMGFQAAPEKGGNVCNYCCEAGHWKSDCPVLRARKLHVGGGPVNSAAGLGDVGVWQGGHMEFGVTGSPPESYLPFIRDGFVTQVGSDTKVPV